MIPDQNNLWMIDGLREGGSEPAVDSGDASLRLSDASFRLGQVAGYLPSKRLAPKVAGFANPPDLILIWYQ